MREGAGAVTTEPADGEHAVCLKCFGAAFLPVSTEGVNQ